MQSATADRAKGLFADYVKHQRRCEDELVEQERVRVDDGERTPGDVHVAGDLRYGAW